MVNPVTPVLSDFFLFFPTPVLSLHSLTLLSIYTNGIISLHYLRFCEYIQCLFVLVWEKQQNLRQGFKYLLELSKCNVGEWSIYPPDPIPRLNVALVVLIPQLL